MAVTQNYLQAQFGWAKTFVETISPIVPMAKNFANNPHAHPIMPVYYGVVGLSFYVLFVMYFFVENGVFGNDKPRFLNIDTPRYKLILRRWSTLVLGLVCLSWTLSMFINLGLYRSDGSYGRHHSLLMSWAGAVYFGSLLFPIIMVMTVHSCFRLFNLIKKCLDEVSVAAFAQPNTADSK